MENEKRKSPQGSREFVERYWPVLIVGGTAVGAAIWLVTRYIKEKKIRGSSEYIALTQLENEALSVRDETSIILETGTHLTKIAGPDIKTAAEELSKHLEDEKAKEALETLSKIAEMSRPPLRPNTRRKKASS